MMSDDLPGPAQIVKEAIQRQSSVSDIAWQYAQSEKEKNLLMVRAHRYLKRTPGGERIKKYLLNDGAWHRLNAAARLTCSALSEDDQSEDNSSEDDSSEDDKESIIDLMAEGGVPIVALSREANEKRNTYSYWYAQISRNRPKAIDYVLNKQAPDLSLQASEPKGESGASQFFDISSHEFR